MCETWRVEQLGKFCYVKARIGWRGLSSSEYTEDGPYLIAGKHVVSGIIDWERCDHINEFRYSESWEISLKQGDVILTKDGTIGRVARVDSLPGKATINGTMMLLRPSADLDYRFLCHLLNGWGFKKLIEDKVSGSSIPHIFQRDMVMLPISFPSLQHQRKLADILDTLDTTIRQTEVIIAKLQQVKEGLLHDLLTRGIDSNGELRPHAYEAPHLYRESSIGWIPKEWEHGELRNWLSGKPKNGYSPQEAGGWTGKLMLGLGCLTSNGFAPIQLKNAPLQDRNVDSALLSDGDLLISRANTRELVGLVGVYRKVGHPCSYPDLMMRLTPVTTTSAKFLEVVLGTPSSRKQIKAAASGTSASMVKISSSIVCSLKVAIPKPSEQKLILAAIDRTQGQLHAERSKLAGLKQTQQGLKDDLLTGRVRVTPLLEGSPSQ